MLFARDGYERTSVGAIAAERATLVRLVISEAPHFPAILDFWHNRGLVPIIAEPLAELAASGLLDADDPALAAEHLSALTFGQVSNKSMMGTRPAH